MEFAWLTIALASLYTAINNYIYHGFDNESIKFSILFLLSFAMYLFRRYRRKKAKGTNSQLKEKKQQ